MEKYVRVHRLKMKTEGKSTDKYGRISLHEVTGVPLAYLWWLHTHSWMTKPDHTSPYLEGCLHT